MWKLSVLICFAVLSFVRFEATTDYYTAGFNKISRTLLSEERWNFHEKLHTNKLWDQKVKLDNQRHTWQTHVYLNNEDGLFSVYFTGKKEDLRKTFKTAEEAADMISTRRFKIDETVHVISEFKCNVQQKYIWNNLWSSMLVKLKMKEDSIRAEKNRIEMDKKQKRDEKERLKQEELRKQQEYDAQGYAGKIWNNLGWAGERAYDAVSNAIYPVSEPAPQDLPRRSSKRKSEVCTEKPWWCRANKRRRVDYHLPYGPDENIRIVQLAGRRMKRARDYKTYQVSTVMGKNYLIDARRDSPGIECILDKTFEILNDECVKYLGGKKQHVFDDSRIRKLPSIEVLKIAKRETLETQAWEEKREKEFFQQQNGDDKIVYYIGDERQHTI